MNGTELASALRGGQRVYGTCVTSTAPSWPAMIASTGADFAFVDTEHTPIDRAQLAWICQNYNALRIAPIVRIPEPDPYRACMALDVGAAGVIAPYVETLEQVHALRGAVKFRPLKGNRLYKTLDGSEKLEDPVREYLGERNTGRLMVVNIESVPALEALDAILAVPDIDALLVGPHDLSINLGVPEQYSHPKFSQAISTIIAKARAAQVGVGIHYSEGMDLPLGWAKEGANFIVHSSDVSLVQQSLVRDFARFRRELGDGGPGGSQESIVV